MNKILHTKLQDNIWTIQTSDLTLRHCIQKVATGPEYSKDLSFAEAHSAMQANIG